MRYRLKAACCVWSSRQWGLTELVARATVSTKHLLSFPWRQDSLIIEGVEVSERKSMLLHAPPPPHHYHHIHTRITKCNVFKWSTFMLITNVHKLLTAVPACLVGSLVRVCEQWMISSVSRAPEHLLLVFK